MLLVRQFYGYSYRETLKAVKQALRLKYIPAISTFHYRLRKMPTSLLIEFYNFAEDGHACSVAVRECGWE